MFAQCMQGVELVRIAAHAVSCIHQHNQESQHPFVGTLLLLHSYGALGSSFPHMCTRIQLLRALLGLSISRQETPCTIIKGYLPAYLTIHICLQHNTACLSLQSRLRERACDIRWSFLSYLFQLQATRQEPCQLMCVQLHLRTYQPDTHPFIQVS